MKLIFNRYLLLEMHDHRHEPLVGPVGGSEEEAIQEISGGRRRGGGGPGAQPHQPGQRVRVSHGGAGPAARQEWKQVRQEWSLKSCH